MFFHQKKDQFKAKAKAEDGTTTNLGCFKSESEAAR